MAIYSLIGNKALMKKALRLATRARSARAVASILRNLEIYHVTASKSRRFRVLALSINKSGFLEDVLECFHETTEFDVISWPSYALPSVARQILSHKIDNNTYMIDEPEITRSKAAYRKFIGAVCGHLSKRHGLHAVIAPNFHYSVQRELAAALEERGIPFIVLHKENLKSPGRVDFWRYMYKRRGVFLGRKILVYNDIERDLQLEVGVTEPERVIVTGMPRLDRIHRWRQEATRTVGSNASVKQLLFFAFDRFDKLPAQRQFETDSSAGVAERWSELSWTSISEETHKAVVELAMRRPDIRVVVKTKSIERQTKDVERMLKDASDPLPPNLKIVNGGDSFELLKQSSIVVGFNTTAQLEALAAGKPVIVPWYGEAIASRTKDFVIDLGAAVTYAHSRSELVEIASSMIDRADGVTKDIDAAATQALIRWTGNNDGASGRRVLEIIRSEIQEHHLSVRSPDREAYEE